MQASKRLLLPKLNSINKNIIYRNVAVGTASVNVEDEQIKSWDEIPGPSSLPFIGPLFHFLPGQMLSDFKTMQGILHKEYGPIVRINSILGKPANLFLFDPESCGYILRSENWSPKRPGFESIEYYRKYYNKTPDPNRMTGLITDHGDLWRTFRTTVNPLMMNSKAIKLYSSQLQEVAEDMIKRMKKIRNENNQITNRFDLEMNLWALESIAVVGLGGRLNCFNRELDENSPEKRLIQNVHNVFILANKLDFKPSLWKLYPTKAYKEAMKNFEEQEQLTKYFIQKARNELLDSKKPEEEKGMLEKLLEIDEKMAIIMASDMLFAGVDTAATTMTAILYLLSTNQEKQDKLRQAVESGDQKYLKACIKESHRMMPVVGGNMRQTSKDYNILGYKVPKDTFVIFAHQFLSKMEEQFPRANDYIPERWIEEGPLNYKSAHPFAFSPFGFGVRMCIGRRIAELEIETFLAEVIKNFKVEWTGPPPEVVATSLNYIKGPFNFTFKDV